MAVLKYRDPDTGDFVEITGASTGDFVEITGASTGDFVEITGASTGGGTTDVNMTKGRIKEAGQTLWRQWSGTQAQYDALGTYDPNTLYVVI